MEGRGGETEGGLEGGETELLEKRTHRNWAPASERMDQTGKLAVEGSIPHPPGWVGAGTIDDFAGESGKKSRLYGGGGKFEKPIEKYHSFAAVSCSGL